MISFRLFTIFVCLAATVAHALVNPSLDAFGRTSTVLSETSDFDRPSTFLDEEVDGGDITISFVDEDSEDEEEKKDGQGRKRWENLNPKIKQRLIERGQEKAIANKKKREPAQDKKRRKYLLIDLECIAHALIC